uniref:NADH:ubiquinone reductase (H(+)-translocating) n=1 Tax=Batillipes longispinosus TaxID=1477119 RepID=A0A0K0KAY8_9BILA|nr:NADH dehydogenase subunit 5 [Batillipes longispinosus]
MWSASMLMFSSIFSMLLSLKPSVVWITVPIISWFNFMDFSLMVDQKSLMFSSLVMMIASSIFMFMHYYMDSDKSQAYFYLTVALFVLSMMMLIYGGSFISLILGWDGLGVVSYLLVIYYFSINSSNSGMVTFLSNRVGDVFFISGIIISAINFNLEVWAPWMINLVGLMMFMCFITKSAQFPYSTWLPAAMAAPTPVSALVHSSTLVTAGVFLSIRFNGLMSNSMCCLLFLLGLFTSCYAGLMAFAESDMKKVIALSTLSQLGFMFMSLGSGLIWLCFYHMMTHAIFKASLFFASGVFIHNMGSSQDYRGSFNFVVSSPILASIGLLTTMSLIGFPFSTGFYTKDLIIDLFGSKLFSLFIQFLSSFAIFLTMIYMARFVYLVFVINNKSNPHSKVEENQIVNIITSLMFMMMLIYGGSFIMMNFYCDAPLVIGTGWKIFFINMMMFTPIMIIIFISTKNLIDAESSTFSNMIYIPYLTVQVSQYSSQPLSLGLTNHSDKGWLEYWGAMGMNMTLLQSGSLMNFTMIYGMWGVFIPLSILSLM